MVKGIYYKVFVFICLFVVFIKTSLSNKLWTDEIIIRLPKEEISLRNNRGRARARLLPRSSAEVGRRRYLEPITLRSSLAQSRVE